VRLHSRRVGRLIGRHAHGPADHALVSNPAGRGAPHHFLRSAFNRMIRELNIADVARVSVRLSY
jgi:hypothetical protein